MSAADQVSDRHQRVSRAASLAVERARCEAAAKAAAARRMRERRETMLADELIRERWLAGLTDEDRVWMAGEAAARAADPAGR